jgi:hypothetical protein
MSPAAECCCCRTLGAVDQMPSRSPSHYSITPALPFQESLPIWNQNVGVLLFLCISIINCLDTGNLLTSMPKGRLAKAIAAGAAVIGSDQVRQVATYLQTLANIDNYFTARQPPRHPSAPTNKSLVKERGRKKERSNRAAN